MGCVCQFFVKACETTDGNLSSYKLELNTSSSTIGADTSGNDNHWTSNNLASTDIVADHPENNFAR